MINGIHVNCTKPFLYSNSADEYEIDDFEVFSTILSALMWRLYNGPIKLYTDDIALSYYQDLGLTDIWDDGIDTETLKNIPDSINQEIFWAAAKLFAIRKETVPFAIIDTDLIVWKDINEILSDKTLACLHRENLDVDCYLPYDLLKKRDGYNVDPLWDWTERPCNTAFAYFNDPKFVEYYTSQAIDFMIDNGEYPKEMVSQMVFAEQRLFSMCAKTKHIDIYSFLEDPFQKENELFTHLWGTKSIARKNIHKKNELCIILEKKIKREFPNFVPQTAKLKEIFEKYR